MHICTRIEMPWQTIDGHRWTMAIPLMDIAMAITTFAITSDGSSMGHRWEQKFRSSMNHREIVKTALKDNNQFLKRGENAGSRLQVNWTPNKTCLLSKVMNLVMLSVNFSIIEGENSLPRVKH